MSRRDVKDPSLTPAEKTRLRRKVDREWLPALTSSEHKCMVFLFNMVTDWSKSRDRVKQEHFVNGTANVAGTGLSLRTVIRALASLTEKGAVTRLRTPRGHVYTINFDWSPAVEVKARKVPAKPVPASAETPVICQTGTSRYAKLADAQYREIPVQEIPSNRSPSGCAPVSLKRDRPGREKVTSYVDPLDITNLRATWTAAIAEAFPGITQATWGRREEAQACQFVNLDDKAKRASALDVFAWSIRSWRQIVAARFAWMDKSPPPEFPSIAFMARWRDRFFDAWSDRKRLREDIVLNSRDRRVRQLMHAGATYEEALKEAADRDSLQKARIQVAETQAKLDRMFRHVEARPSVVAHARAVAMSRPMEPRHGGPTAPTRAALAAFGPLPAIGAAL